MGRVLINVSKNMKRSERGNLDKQRNSTRIQKVLKCAKLVNPFIFQKQVFLHLGLRRFSAAPSKKREK